MQDKVIILLMDRNHRCLLRQEDGWSLPSMSYPSEERPLPLLKKFIKEQFKIDLPGPSGQYPLKEQGKDPPRHTHYTFILPHDSEAGPGPSPSAGRWVPLREIRAFLADPLREREFWEVYAWTVLGGARPPQDFDVFFFGNTPAMAARLAHLVRKGKKRGTTSLAQANHHLHVGLISLVTDGFGHPLCFIETVKLDVLAFADISAEMAYIEGEGDFSLEDWKDAHRSFFIQEAGPLGLTFEDKTSVLFEQFKVLSII